MIVLSKFADILQTFFKEVRYGIESCLGGGYIAEPPQVTLTVSYIAKRICSI